MRAISILPVPLTLFCCGSAQAWWDEGHHMQIAYLAYQRLVPAAKDRADDLLKLNPDYANWIAGAPDGKERLYAFVHASTWADDIKTKADYDDDQLTDSTARQNVPYGHLRHAYWHFRDLLDSPDGTALPAPDPVDAVSMSRDVTKRLPRLLVQLKADAGRFRKVDPAIGDLHA